MNIKSFLNEWPWEFKCSCSSKLVSESIHLGTWSITTTRLPEILGTFDKFFTNEVPFDRTVFGYFNVHKVNWIKQSDSKEFANN